MPAHVPASMSVSSRSPTTSGARAPTRSTDSRMSGANGLPATTGARPVAAETAATRVPLPGAIPSGGGDGQVGVRGHEHRPGTDRVRRLREVTPRHVGAVPHEDGDRPLGGERDGLEATGTQRLGHPGTADREHPARRRHARRDLARAGLGGRDDVGVGDREPELAQVLGHDRRAVGRRCS